MSPRYCRRAAYELFAEHAQDLESATALVGAATALSMHALDDVHPGVVEEQLEALTASVRRRLQSRSLSAVMAHLHGVLFEQEGYAGNRVDYYDPANSYLPRVLSSRRGIPISLALVYKTVGERLGLEVHGIGAPGHFLVRVADTDGSLLVDPFHQGRVLSTEEAFRLMEGTLGTAVPRAGELLRPVGHAEWIARMLRNLEAIHRKRAQPRDAAAMRELRLLVEAQ
jgi:regulator of sirC expression with transglutaminase-like and TPR domain